MQVVTLHRWQIAACFAVLAVVFTVVGWWAHDASTTAHATAVRAEGIAEENQRVLAAVLRNRRETVERIHVEQVRSCRSRHKLYVTIHDLLGGFLPRSGAPLTARQKIGVARIERALVRLRGADCRTVPTLTVKPKPKPKPTP